MVNLVINLKSVHSLIERWYGLWLRAEEEKVFLPPVNLLISKKSLSMGQKNIMKGKSSSETLEGIGQKRGHHVEENMEEHLVIVMNDSVTNLGLL